MSVYQDIMALAKDVAGIDGRAMNEIRQFCLSPELYYKLEASGHNPKEIYPILKWIEAGWFIINPELGKGGNPSLTLQYTPRWQRNMQQMIEDVQDVDFD